MQTALQELKIRIEAELSKCDRVANDHNGDLAIANNMTQRRCAYENCLKQISDLFPEEREDIEQAYGDGLNHYRFNCNRNEYFDKIFPNHGK